MANTTSPRLYALVALDLGRAIARPAELAGRLNRAAFAGRVSVVSFEVTEIPDPRRNAEAGDTVTRIRYILDSAAIRNTTAHSRAFEAGYLVNTEAA